MLAESIIRVGRPIVQGNLPNEERIRLLTDVWEEKCKKFFKHIFAVEIDESGSTYHFLEMTGNEEAGSRRTSAFPVLYPNGGRVLVTQGIYPVPCYLVFDKHIKAMNQPDIFAEKVILPRLKNTVPYKGYSEEELYQVAGRVAGELCDHYSEFLSTDKQWGILYIVDHRLPTFHVTKELETSKRYLWIVESSLKSDENVYLDCNKALADIVEGRFLEAKSLGHAENEISTFTNRREREVVSIYNKSWLWLSHTWKCPRSIYWNKDEWTKGIKIDKKNYEAFLYGAQFLKQITVPITGGLLKELFAPVTSVEAKRHMSAASFDTIFGVPLVLPLLEGDSQQLYEKYRRILKNERGADDLQLKILAGIDRMIPKFTNEHRLMILYYSGNLSRGNMHLRMLIEDVIPSVAATLQAIIRSINKKELLDIRHFFHVPSSAQKPFYWTETLPTMLSNAYGPGYLWSSIQSVFHKEPIALDRLYRTTAVKLTELANKEDHWGMVDELIFHYMFLTFYDEYNKRMLNQKGVNPLSRWTEMIEKYHQAGFSTDDLETAESLGFVSGLLLRQFSNSYQVKTGRDFVKHRVMKFGSQLTPQMVWKNGVLRCEELKEQWSLNVAGNFYPILGIVLAAFIDVDEKGLLTKEKDKFMTAFWSGYLVYRKPPQENESGAAGQASKEEEMVNGK